MKRAIIMLSLSIGLLSFALSTHAQESEVSDQSVYGWQMMSDEERQTFRTQMRALTTPAARQQYRAAHHQKMQARAEAQGTTLAKPHPQSRGEMGGRRHPQGAGNRPQFTDFDLDNDGSITSDEFETAHTQRIEARQQENRKLRHLANAKSFSDIDTDGDGRASREEFAKHQTRQPMKRHRLQ